MRGLSAFAAQFGKMDDRLPPGFPLALADAGDLHGVRIGWGFQVYDVDAAALASKANLEDVARPTGIWRYEVLAKGRPVGLATVAKTSQGWQVVSFGGTGLARDIHALMVSHGTRADTHLRYVRVPQATADFIAVQRGGAPARFAPLQAARDLLQGQGHGVPRDGLLDGAVLRAQLRQAVKTNGAN
ncbi:hypothetical protein [Thermomonas sp.]|uniref:hypothetical protein n=1 Tax=Thermomonas sp. TaxID=1971895 RepID=UPI0035B48133